ncbi:MAG: FKBP-type peptidyl-prolyl cis-trans isomerase [Flavobacteriales bacterium]|nr:FKBP-type peptidyl-prolyl cis-trans isomerase [Flavobacteriales bacterium]
MNKIRLISFLVILLSCCAEKPEFFTSNGGIKYKLLDFSPEENSIELGAFLSLYTSYFNDNDSLFYSSTIFKANHLEYHYLKTAESGTFQEVLSELHLGDSAAIYIETDNFFLNYLESEVPEFLKADSIMTVHVRVVDSQSYAEHLAQIRAQHDWMEMKELSILKKYLERSQMNFRKERGGVHVAVIETDTVSGQKINFGDLIKLNYEGKFLEGENVFYSTYRNSVPDEFSYGRKGQLIEGLEVALSGRKYGDSIEVLVPSNMAFGENGSAGGLVPGYTALHYCIRILPDN